MFKTNCKNKNIVIHDIISCLPGHGLSPVFIQQNYHANRAYIYNALQSIIIENLQKQKNLGYWYPMIHLKYQYRHFIYMYHVPQDRTPCLSHKTTIFVIFSTWYIIYCILPKILFVVLSRVFILWVELGEYNYDLL